ncbi:MAG: type II toxin-antitoxin system RelE/ParE family toxin [Campylobacterales bacterium]
MIYRVFLLPSAYNDLEAARDFYNSISLGLGDYCTDTLLSEIDSLVFFAGIHSRHYGHFRLLSRRFPYAIYYKISGSSAIVTAILDTRQNPATHINRLA